MTGTHAQSDDPSVAYADLRTSLRSYLRRRVANQSLVEDLVQDVFLKAATAAQAGRSPSNLTGWLYAAARTTVVDHYRSMRPETVELDETLADAEADDTLLHQQLANCLRPLAQQLPAIYRDTLLAADFDGQSLQSLADKQGLSVSAVKSRASRGRMMLKHLLLECCHVETGGGLVNDYRRRPTASCGGGCRRGCS
jgi:RNA polymerase sigma-70 factor, ECF subfamily